MSKLAELQLRYEWVAEALAQAHAEGKIKSESVRFFIDYRQPLLYDEDGEPIRDSEGRLRYDLDAELIYFGRAQAYSYVGWIDGQPTGTVAGQVDLPLEILDYSRRPTQFSMLCGELDHAFEHQMEAHEQSHAQPAEEGRRTPPARSSAATGGSQAASAQGL